MFIFDVQMKQKPLSYLANNNNINAEDALIASRGIQRAQFDFVHEQNIQSDKNLWFVYSVRLVRKALSVTGWCNFILYGIV